MILSRVHLCVLGNFSLTPLLNSPLIVLCYETFIYLYVVVMGYLT